ncbi:MAG: hypothetical protein WCX65_15795, partial [bacterium]
MRRLYLTVLLILGVAAVSGQARAAVSFKFKIPTIPFTPILSDISNSSAVTGAASFSVFATIRGDLQQKACCGATCNDTDCEMDEWKMVTDTSVSPNPPCIPNENGMPGMPDNVCKIVGAQNPMLFYYKENEIADTNSVPMAYDATTGKFKGTIKLDGFADKDVIYYYIVASDSRGNVISMTPDSAKAPCTSIASWNPTYETPAVDDCSVANGYEQCAVNVAAKPSCFSSDYSVNDREADTCGEPSSSGAQVPVSGQENTDFLGFSAGAGKGYVDLPSDDVICAKIRLKGAPPASSSGPIEGYLMMLFNPDISDPNPGDIYFPNVFAITYAPEAASADKNLVNVLWDGECVSNPNTSDILGCKIVVGNEGEPKLKIGFDTNQHHLKFIAKNAVSTNTGNKVILGAASNQLRMLFLTGEINISGGTAFWIVDLSAGLMLVKNTRQAVVGPIEEPMPPIIQQTTCKAGGVGSFPVCAKSVSKPAGGNDCVIDILPSPDTMVTSIAKYKVYVSDTNSKDNAVYDPSLDITENGSLSYSISKNIPSESLEGQTKYFFFSSMSGGASPKETLKKYWAATSCRAEDWKAPDPPSGATCATPDGNEKKCLCSWTQDPDPLVGYNIKRNGTTLPLNTSIILSPSYTDSSSVLVNGTAYTYQIQAVDSGNNESGWTNA